MTKDILVMFLTGFISKYHNDLLALDVFSDNMKQPAAILLLQYWYTILVIPVSSSICNTVTDTGKY